MGRNILAVIAGVLVGWVVVMAMEIVSHAIYGFANPEVINSKQKLAEFIQSLPKGALLFIALAHFLGAFAAFLVTFLISRKNQWMPFIPVVLLLLSTISLQFMIPHPTWFMVLDVCVPVLGGLVAFLVTKTKRG